MIDRELHARQITGLLKRFPVVAILGARQVGKTTLAASIAPTLSDRISRFDLENPSDLARLADPMLALQEPKGLVVLDEVQRRPELFPVLRVLADRKPVRTRFLVLGSAAPDLLRQSSESLAGRIAYYELPGLAVREVGFEHADRLWVRGGFPKAFLARSDRESMEWRQAFIRTFLERDLPALGVNIAADTMRRFWSMLAHHHAQLWNASEIGRSFGVADTTVRNYLDKLTDALVVRQLKPWHENLGKRQVKAPKIFIRDSGLLHALLNLPTKRDIEGHPKLGASWEGFIIDQLGLCWAHPQPSFGSQVECARDVHITFEMEFIDPKLPGEPVNVFDSDRPKVVFLVRNIGFGWTLFNDRRTFDSRNGRQWSHSVAGCGASIDLLAQAKSNPAGSYLCRVKFAFEERRQVHRQPRLIHLDLPLNVDIAPAHLQLLHIYKGWPYKPCSPVVHIDRLRAHAN